MVMHIEKLKTSNIVAMAVVDPGSPAREDEAGEVAGGCLQETEGRDGDTATATFPGECICQPVVDTPHLINSITALKYFLINID